MHTRKFLAVLSALAVATACNDSPEQSVGPFCPSDLRARIDRPTVTLRVADSTRLQATALRCGGTIPLTTSWVWTSTPGGVVRVDASTGWVYAVRVGSGDVVATSPAHGIAILSNVTVVP